MTCPYEQRRRDWERQCAHETDEWLLRKLAVPEPTWDCGPHMWTSWKLVLKREACKRGLKLGT